MNVKIADEVAAQGDVVHPGQPLQPVFDSFLQRWIGETGAGTDSEHLGNFAQPAGKDPPATDQVYGGVPKLARSVTV